MKYSSSLRPLTFLASLAALGLVSTTSEAADPVLRFSDAKPGNVVAIGNTLGLSKGLNVDAPGTQDAIGTFITLDTTSMDAGWPAGTTDLWQDNESAAVLTLPAAAEITPEVLYAELVWGGSFQYGGEDVTTDLGSSVTLSFNGGAPLTVSPDVDTAVTENYQGIGFPIRYYMRSNEVTSYVQQHLSGTYSVAGVPATQGATTNNATAAGWTLVVAYRYDNEPIRNLSVFVGNDPASNEHIFVDENTTVDYNISGFCAPTGGTVEGSIAIATLEGDASRVGDQLAIGDSPSDLTFINLFGANNPVNNFFCSQLNGSNGLLDTSGTFGNVNHTPCTAATSALCSGSNVSGGRQGWDIANVELTSSSGHLAINQTSATLRTKTLDDSYMPVLAGMSIDVNAPKFLYDQSKTTVDKTLVTIGDSFELTVTLVNQGLAPATNVAFTLPLASGLTLTNFSTDGMTGDVNGMGVVQSQLNSGVPMGTLASNESRTVVLDVEVTGAQSSDVVLKPVWKYDYKMCVNGPTTSEIFKASAVGIDYEGPTGTGGAGGGGTGGDMTSASGGSSGDGGAGGGAEPLTATPQGGGLFSCTTSAPTDGNSGLGALAGLALLGVALRVRRRRAR
jgi:uncharacterized repeat protein (TIGR01451 family)/MYXO-CTERM domain-containing protein